MTLIPLHGVDYASRSDVLAAFQNNDIFLQEDNHGHQSRTALERLNFTEVSVRYNGLTRVVTLEKDFDGNWRAR